MAQELTVGFVNPPSGLKQQFQRAKKDGLRKSIDWWHEVYMPRHFRAGAKNRYDYEPRTQKYLKRKREEAGHEDPMTFSGKMKSKMQRMPKIKFDDKGGLINFRGMPRYTYILQNSPKWLELINTTEDEGRVMAGKYAKFFPDELKKHPIRKRTR